MKQLIPYLTTDHCKEAVSYYHAIFGGEIKKLPNVRRDSRF